MSAYQALYASDDEKLDVGASLINLAQGLVRFDFDTEFVSVLLNSKHDGVTVLARNFRSERAKTYHAQYLVGADGSYSAVRKAQALKHTYYFLSDHYWGITAPLDKPIVEQRTL
ncbi:uncharacterized protein PV06_10353 [Exophiala oligosperma]|uniref:FAD-binding domain-containing protein n=1 Tax=Exophiala oligosperma TaxID=215243 RepID=A0A0D2BJY8_9EURO|nr:uncharacterized protein PV06_10353 [Exophiala oligosperma]KIW37722.1 hypothetical protein PV06_10353 [Exophiala oligosperma]